MVPKGKIILNLWFIGENFFYQLSFLTLAIWECRCGNLLLKDNWNFVVWNSAQFEMRGLARVGWGAPEAFVGTLLSIVWVAGPGPDRRGRTGTYHTNVANVRNYLKTLLCYAIRTQMAVRFLSQTDYSYHKLVLRYVICVTILFMTSGIKGVANSGNGQKKMF